MKTPDSLIDGTPEKRLFWSIINDYDFTTAICELIDNSLDLWLKADKAMKLEVTVEVDHDRQIIIVSDNGGGVSKQNLRLLVTPGGSNNDPDGESIGVFGVGSKRAVVALGENITIRTRHGSGTTYAIDIDKDWLASPDWNLPSYSVLDIDEGTTTIEASQLRRSVSERDVEALKSHLSETYAKFLAHANFRLLLNGTPLVAKTFDHWSFPPGHDPVYLQFAVGHEGGKQVMVTIEAGLINDRDPANDNYGVYAYCNGRLIEKEMRIKEVGYFSSSEAGTPHPDASLARVIVQFDGPASLMPWNSSKSAINTKHATFEGGMARITEFTTHFSKLSRALKGTWDTSVFPYTEGTITEIEGDLIKPSRKVVMPKIPRSNKTTADHLRASNESVIATKPYVVGLIEAIAAVDLIMKSRLETSSRIALIILDSTYEIALKEYMVHNPSAFRGIDIDVLLKNRTDVELHVWNYTEFDETIREIAQHYYLLRNKLIHERTTAGVTAGDIDRYRDAIKRLLTKLFIVNWNTPR